MAKRRVFLLIIFGHLSAAGLLGQIHPHALCDTVKLEELRKRNFYDTADLLGYLPGLGVRHIGIPGQWTALSARGQDFSRATIRLDGIPLQDPWTGFSDLNWIPEAWIDSVRVYPALDPSTPAPGGGVYLQTFGAGIQRPYTRFAYRKGKDDFSDLDVSFIEPLGQTLKFISGMTRSRYAGQLPDRGSDLTAFRAKILCLPHKNWRIAYTLLSNKHELFLPFLTSVSRDAAVYDSMKRMTRRTDHAAQVTGSVLNLGTEAAFHYASLDYTYENDAVRLYFPVSVFDAHLIQKPNRCAVPVSWGLSIARNELNTPETGRVYQTQTVGFIQSDFIRYHRLNVGARLSPYFSNYGNHFTGSLRISCKPSLSFAGWIQASNGVRMPSLGEHTGLFHQPFPMDRWSDASGAISNALLGCETDKTLETGWTWRPGKKCTASFRGYGSFVADVIQPKMIEGKIQFKNAGENRLWGTETMVALEPIQGLHADAVLNTLSAQDQNGQVLYDRPTVWGNAALAVEQAFFQSDLKLIFYFGCRYSTEWWHLIENDIPIRMPSWTLLDVKITAVVMQRARLFISMDNVTGSPAEVFYGFPFLQKAVQTGFAWELND